MPAGEPSIPSDPTSPTATGRFFIARTEAGLSPTPAKPGFVGVAGEKTADEYEYDVCEEEPPKAPPNAAAGAAATHANASAVKSAARKFRTRRHTAGAKAKRCAGGAEARARAAASEDVDVVAS